jgi:hypothetical protein
MHCNFWEWIKDPHALVHAAGTKALDSRSFTALIEKALFAMVATRALAPSSKLPI